jgi:hypothetical protein
VNGDLSQAAMLPLHRDTTYVTEAQLDKSIAYAGMYSEAGDMFPSHAHTLYAQPRDSIAPLIDSEHAADSRSQLSLQKKSYRNILPLRHDKEQAGVSSFL